MAYFTIITALILSFFAPYKVHYHLIGMLATAGPPMMFSGHIDHNILTGHGEITTQSPQGMICKGASVANSRGLTCNGMTGTASLTCVDGRKLSASWTLKDCDSGIGSGQDNQGYPFVYAIGETESQAKSLFKTLSLPHDKKS